jgi:hypothetical protein
VRIIYLFYWNSCESHTGVTQPLENGLADLKVKGFYRYDSHAVRVPRLECRKGLPLRTLLARLIGFVAAFCNEGERGDSIFASSQNAGANPIGPASGVRSGNPFTNSSQGIWTARGS